MRIGNIHLPAVTGADRPPATRRAEADVRQAPHTAATDTGDLPVLSAGLGALAAAEGQGTQRQTLVNSLKEACDAGTYRPDVARIADKLLRWGFTFEDAGGR